MDHPSSAGGAHDQGERAPRLSRSAQRGGQTGSAKNLGPKQVWVLLRVSRDLLVTFSVVPSHAIDSLIAPLTHHPLTLRRRRTQKLTLAATLACAAMGAGCSFCGEDEVVQGVHHPMSRHGIVPFIAPGGGGGGRQVHHFCSSHGGRRRPKCGWRSGPNDKRPAVPPDNLAVSARTVEKHSSKARPSAASGRRRDSGAFGLSHTSGLPRAAASLHNEQGRTAQCRHYAGLPTVISGQRVSETWGQIQTTAYGSRLGQASCPSRRCAPQLVLHWALTPLSPSQRAAAAAASPPPTKR